MAWGYADSRRRSRPSCFSAKAITCLLARTAAEGSRESRAARAAAIRLSRSSSAALERFWAGLAGDFWAVGDCPRAESEREKGEHKSRTKVPAMRNSRGAGYQWDCRDLQE